MTIAEIQQLRTAAFNAYLSLMSGGLLSYSVGGRTATKMNPQVLLDHLAQLDAMIARQSTGMFGVAKFRQPE